MEPRISLITLGVSDLPRARAFYETLGFSAGTQSNDEVVFFRAGGMVLAVWDRAELATDSGTQAHAPGAVTLAHNVASPAEVNAVLAEASAAGAHLHRAGAPTPWGGYSGVFHDPDGHAWEIAHNPDWPLTDSGTVQLP